MGAQLSSSTVPISSSDLQTLFVDIPSYVYQSFLGGTKYLKSVQCLHDEGVVVKVYVKREKPISSTSSYEQGEIRRYEVVLDLIKDRLSLYKQPSVLPLLKLDQTEKAVYLIRQHFAFNLADRFHSHPFLTLIEKKWIAYQLLTGLHQMHCAGIRHGDLKCENLMVTTWNWLFISDIAFYKPTLLPIDNPADYSDFYETSIRRRCYIAPERFYADKKSNVEHSSSLTSNPLLNKSFNAMASSGGATNVVCAGSDSLMTESMDIFSMGCIIAEIFLGGDALFDLPQLLEYRDGKYDPLTVIQKIGSPEVRELIFHMIQRDPTQRWGAKQYLQHYSPSIFPKYFRFLYKMFSLLLSPKVADPDSRVTLLKDHQFEIIKEIVGIDKDQMEALAGINNSTSSAFVSNRIDGSAASVSEMASQNFTNTTVSPQPTIVNPNLTIDELRERIDAISKGGSIDSKSQKPIVIPVNKEGSVPPPPPTLTSPRLKAVKTPKLPEPGGILDPSVAEDLSNRLWIDSADAQQTESDGTSFLSASPESIQSSGAGLTMVVSVILSSLQNVRYPITKLAALELMADFGIFVDDEVRLNRLVPYCVTMLSDAAAVVRSCAVSVMAGLLVKVQSFSLGDSHVFPDYILPALSRFPQDPEESVRVAYAQNIGTLAETARRFLDIAHTPKPTKDGLIATTDSHANQTVTSSFDSELHDLQSAFLRIIIDMLTFGGSVVKRALLGEITRICVFLGKGRTADEVLPHIISILNDRGDWRLKAAFFENIVGIAVFVGSAAHHNILPCLEQGLIDPEEFVLQKAVKAIGDLVNLNLFDKKMVIELGAKCFPLLMVPSLVVRNEAIQTISFMHQFLGMTKSYCFLLPLLRPLIQQEIYEISPQILSIVLKNPLTRAELRMHTGQSAGSQQTQLSPSPSISSTSSAPLSTSPSSSLTTVSSFNNNFSNFPTKSNFITGDDSDNTSVSPSPPPVAKEADSGFSNDVDLQNALSPWLQRVAMQVRSVAPVDEDAEAAANIAAMENDIPLYAIEYEKTVGDITATMNPIDRIQQDLLDSLGVQVQVGKSSGSAISMNGSAAGSQSGGLGASDTQIRLMTSNQSQNPRVGGPGPGQYESNRRDGRRKQPVKVDVKKVEDYIPIALQIPPPPPQLGSLNPSTVSISGFYGNFHQLDYDQRADERDPKNWRPRGILVATLNEHRGAVTKLAVSRDNLFLASGSDDGTVKIWDCQKLKSQPNARANCTWNQKSRITSICVCDSSHSVAAASENGHVQVFKVEYLHAKTDDKQQSQTRYGGLTEFKKVDAGEGPVLVVDHYNTATESLLVYGTRAGIIHGWDLRASNEMFKLKVDPGMGLLSALCIGPSAYCLCVGTSRGFVVAFDLRFHIPVQIWRHQCKTRILHLTPQDVVSVLPRDASNFPQHPAKGPLLFVSAEGQNSIAAFDLFTGECRCVFRVQDNYTGNWPLALANTVSAASTASTSPSKSPASPQSSSSAVSPSKAVAPKTKSTAVVVPTFRSYLFTQPALSVVDELFVKEMKQQSDVFGLTQPSITGFMCCRDNFILTAGTDRIMRFWDLRDPADSYRLVADDLPGAAIRYSGRMDLSAVVFEETVSVALEPPTSDGKGKEGKEREKESEVSSSAARSPSTSLPESDPMLLQSKLMASKIGRGQHPPSPAHTSDITDLVAMEFPLKMLATCSTDGLIKVWI